MVMSSISVSVCSHNSGSEGLQLLPKQWSSVGRKLPVMHLAH